MMFLLLGSSKNSESRQKPGPEETITHEKQGEPFVALILNLLQMYRVKDN